MTTKARTLPSTMVSPETGETLTRDVRPFTVTYKGRSATVDLPGYYPLGDGNGVHVGDDMSVYCLLGEIDLVLPNCAIQDISAIWQ